MCYRMHVVSQKNPPMADDMVDDVAQKRESLENFIQREQYLKDEKDLEHLKRSAEAELAELTELLQQSPNKDTIHSVLRHILQSTSQLTNKVSQSSDSAITTTIPR